MVVKFQIRFIVNYITSRKDAENHFTVDGLKETLMPDLVLLQEIKVDFDHQPIKVSLTRSRRFRLSSLTQTGLSSTPTATALCLEHLGKSNFEYTLSGYIMMYMVSLKYIDWK